jgi:hypothetical protein
MDETGNVSSLKKQNSLKEITVTRSDMVQTSRSQKYCCESGSSREFQSS